MIDSLPACSGTYVLLMQLENPQRITVGRLGRYTMQAGWYDYIGSAFGPGGLRARLRHHASIASRPHWHIDHLRRYAELIEIWYTDSGWRREHDYAALLARLPGSRIPVAGFGASDCHCRSHLFYHVERPDVQVFRLRVADLCPQDEIQVLDM
jgi:Uri superfamily endonuclease